MHCGYIFVDVDHYIGDIQFSVKSGIALISLWDFDTNHIFIYNGSNS